MATATPSVPKDDITIEMYTPSAHKPGLRYEAYVTALIEADSKRTPQQVADGVHASVNMPFPKEEDGKPALERYKRYFRESAQAHDVSASVAEETDQGDTVLVRYTVGPRQTRTKKPKPEQPEGVVEAEVVDDEPVEEQAAA